jgi:hypothetical protein
MNIEVTFPPSLRAAPNLIFSTIYRIFTSYLFWPKIYVVLRHLVLSKNNPWDTSAPYFIKNVLNGPAPYILFKCIACFLTLFDLNLQDAPTPYFVQMYSVHHQPYFFINLPESPASSVFQSYRMTCPWFCRYLQNIFVHGAQVRGSFRCCRILFCPFLPRLLGSSLWSFYVQGAKVLITSLTTEVPEPFYVCPYLQGQKTLTLDSILAMITVYSIFIKWPCPLYLPFVCPKFKGPMIRSWQYYMYSWSIIEIQNTFGNIISGYPSSEC